MNFVKRNPKKLTEWVHYWWTERSPLPELEIAHYINVDKVLPNASEKIYWEGGAVTWRCWCNFLQLFFTLLGITVFALIEVFCIRFCVIVLLLGVVLRGLILTHQKYYITEKRIIIQGPLRTTTFDFKNYLKHYQFYPLKYKIMPHINGTDIALAVFKSSNGPKITSIGFDFVSKKDFYEIIHILQRITLNSKCNRAGSDRIASSIVGMSEDG